MTEATRSATSADAGSVEGPVRLPLHLRSVTDGPDPLLLALARYVQALEERYPDGPEQMRSEVLAARANMPTVRTITGSTR